MKRLVYSLYSVMLDFLIALSVLLGVAIFLDMGMGIKLQPFVLAHSTAILVGSGVAIALNFVFTYMSPLTKQQAEQ